MQTPILTRDQCRHVDQLAMEQYGISGLVLMENAGRGTTEVLCSTGVSGPVVICCGKGNNAGDGFVIARHLDLRGVDVRVLLWAEPSELAGDAATNFRILERIGVTIEHFSTGHDPDKLAGQISGAAWIVDALLGTGARGNPRPPIDAVIEQINAAGPPVLAVDLPSGLDCDTGEPAVPTVRAVVTCTFLAAKVGFLVPGAERYTGELHVLDIGVPGKLIAACGFA